MATTPIYQRWKMMRARCGQPSFKQFRDYGGRGICVCEEWQRFPAFAAWALANGFQDHLELDRIDPDGNYEPANCRWITHFANMQNMRRSVRIEVRGETFSLAEAAIKFGVNKFTLRGRLNMGVPPERAVRPERLQPHEIPPASRRRAIA